MVQGAALRSTRFEVRRELGEGGMGVVYEAYDRKVRSRVALKRLKGFDGDSLLHFKNEFRALADIAHPNLVRLGELFFDEGSWFFTMELVDGKDFLTYVRHEESATGAAFDERRLRESLRQLASALVAFHASGRVHRDVKPANVLIEPSGRLVLLDFGLVDETHATFRPMEPAGGTPTYMAPEQARGCATSEAVDWYALGVMLYRALTGALPFEGPADKLMQHKMAEDPVPPIARDASIPPDLSALCVDLLAREPELRPSGVEVLTRLGARTREAPRAPPGDPEMPTFVGREEELEALDLALARTQKGAMGPRAVVVEGAPGEGKTALVNRFLHRAQARDPELLVLRGRCYEQEVLPFRALDAVVDALSLYLDVVVPAALEPLLAFGNEALPDLFPVLRRVRAIRLRTSERRAQRLSPERRARAFDELRAILARIAERRPLVVFVDDLQWADTDSLDLLGHLFAEREAPACLFVATLRSTDRGMALAASAVDAAIEDVVHLRLRGLDDRDASTLLSHFLGPENERIGIREALLREAGGHPLFLAELGRWADAHDAEELGSVRLDEVLFDRVRALPLDARRLLEIASLIGVPIRREVLADTAGIDSTESLRSLRMLRHQQMLRGTLGGEDRLVEPYHDRVREAVLAHLTIDGESLARLHERVGKSLLAHTPEAELDGQIFAIVRHLDLASQVLDPEAHHSLATLLHRAVRRAKAATAYDQALVLVERALAHALDPRGSRDADLERELLLEQMEITYLAGRLIEGRALYQALEGRRAGPIERADLETRKVELDTVQGRYDEAIDTGLRGLRRLGVSLPRRPGNTSVLKEHATVRWAQGGRPIATWAELPEMDDDRLRAATHLLMALTPVTFFVDTVLLTLVLMRITRISLAHGVTEISAYAFAGYGGVLSGAFNRYEEAFALGEAAERLNARFANVELDAKISFLRGLYGTPWVRPFEQAYTQLRNAAEAGRRHGDPVYESYAAGAAEVLTMCSGGPLDVLTSCCETALVITRRRRDMNMTTMLEAFSRYARRLSGEEPIGDRSAYEVDATRIPVGAFYGHLMAAKEAFLFGDLEEAEARLTQSDALSAVIFGAPTVVELRFWHALVDAEEHRRASSLARARLTSRMIGHLRALERWATSCPANFEPHRALMAAELARMQGRRSTEARYEEAIAAAARHGCPEREALARERLARHALDHPRHFDAGSRLDEAILAYQRFGAAAKAAALEEERHRLAS